MTFLSSGSLVFSVPWKLFLTKKNQDQKVFLKLFFSQLIFLQETLINIKTRHFHSSVDHQEHFFHWTRINSYFRPVNIAKFLRTAFLYTSRSSRLQMFFKIGVLKSFANFTGKHLCWRIFFKKTFRHKVCNFIKKKLQHGCFPVRFTKFLKALFFIEHFWWLLLLLQRLLLHFFKKVTSHFATLLWRTNIFFFSTHRLMYKKSNSFVYKFVVNCQFF